MTHEINETITQIHIQTQTQTQTQRERDLRHLLELFGHARRNKTCREDYLRYALWISERVYEESHRTLPLGQTIMALRKVLAPLCEEQVTKDFCRNGEEVMQSMILTHCERHIVR